MKPKRTNPLFANFFRANTLVAAAVISLGAAAAPNAFAQSISVNFGANQSGSTISEATKTAGAVPVAGNRWNNTTVNGGGTLGSLIDSTGATTLGSVTWTAQNTWESGSTGATATSENGDLTKGYLDDSGAGWTVNLISPYLRNDIYVIHATDQGNPATMSAVSVNGVFYKGNGAGGTVQASGSGDSWSAANFTTADTLTESTHYIKVLNQPTVSLAGLNSSPGRTAIAGVQVVNAYGGTLSYWDTNGTVSGSGNAGGTWGSDNFWSATADGTGTPGAWADGNAAVFSAGSDGISANTVTISGTQSADAVWVKDGDVTLSGGTLNLTGSAILRGDDTDNSGFGLIIESAITAADVSVSGIVDFASNSNSITGTVTTNGTSVVVADQSWSQISGTGRIQALSPAVLTVGATNLNSTFSGTFIGDGQVTKAGNGNLTLTAASPSFTGTFLVDSGTLTFSNAAGAYSTGLSLTGGGNLAFAGTGNSDPTITVSGNNSAFTGPVSITGARVLVDNANDLGTGAVTVASGGQLWATNAATIPNAISLNGIGTTEGAGNLGAVRFDGNAALGGTVTLLSDSRLTAWTGAAGAITGPLAGAFNLEKTGTGTVTIASTGNTGFTGKATSSAGVLRIADQTSLGTTPVSPVADSIILQTGGLLQGGTAAAGANVTLDANRGITLANGDGGFQVWTGFTMTVNGAVTGPGNFIKGDGGALVVGGTVNVGGSLTGNSGTQTFNGNMTLGGSFNVGSNIVTNLNSPTVSIGGTGTDGFKAWVGTTNINIGTGTFADLELGNGTSQHHTVNHTAGALTVTRDFRIGHWGGGTSVYNISGGSVTQPDTVTNATDEGQANLFIGIDGTGNLNISGTGVVNTTSLVVNGRGGTTSDTLNLTGGRLNIGKWGIRNPGTAIVNLGGGTVGAFGSNWSSSTPMTLTGTGGNVTFNTLDSVDGITERTITLTGALSGAGGLTKTGVGTLNLTNSNNEFSGDVLVQGGTLYLLNKSSNPAGLLKTTGGVLNPGSAAISAKLYAANTELSGGTARFRIGSGVDAIVTGNLDVTAPTNIEVSPVGSISVGQEFPLIDYSGTVTGLGNLNLLPLSNNRYQLALVDNPTTTSINLAVTAIDSLIWTGGDGGLWDDSTSNWKLASNNNPTTFQALDAVLFNDDNLGDVELVGLLNAGAVTVNSSNDYFFFGNGSLTGNSSIIKAGTGTLTLENPNQHVGGNQINGGIIKVVHANGLGGSGNLTTIGAAGTLDLNGTNLESSGNPVRSAGLIINTKTTAAAINSLELTGNTTISSNNPITVGALDAGSGTLNLGSHTLTKEGTGQLTLNGVTVTSGNITINQGSIQLIRDYGANQQAVNLGGTGTLTINPNTSLITKRWGAGLSVTMPIVLNGGTMGSNWPGPNGATFASPINVTADSFFNYGGGYGNVTFSGVISGTGKITRTGDSTVTLTGDNTNSGGFVINSGNVQVGNGGTTGNLGTGPVTNNTTLTFNRSDALNASNAIGGTGQIVKNAAGTLTLSGVNTYTGNTTINTGTLTLADGGKLNFKIGANGVSNKVGGTGAFTTAGDFTVDLSGADTTTGNSWLLVDVNSLAFESFDSTFGIDGFTETSNVHTRVNGLSTWTFDESTGILSVTTISDPYIAWASQITNGKDDRAEDADDDGFTNLQEYLFGTDPTASTGSLVTTTSTPSGLALRWLQRNIPGQATYTLQESSTLGATPWTDVVSPLPAVDGVQTGAPTDYEYWTVTLPIGPGKDFFRVEGVEN